MTKEFNDPAKVFGQGEAPIANLGSDKGQLLGVLQDQATEMGRYGRRNPPPEHPYAGEYGMPQAVKGTPEDDAKAANSAPVDAGIMRECQQCGHGVPEYAYCTATEECRSLAEAAISREVAYRRVRREAANEYQAEDSPVSISMVEESMKLIHPPQLVRLDDHTIKALAEMLNPPPEVRNEIVEERGGPDDARNMITIPGDDLITLLAEHRYDSMRICKCRQRGRITLLRFPSPRAKWEVHVSGLLSIGLEEVRRQEDEIRRDIRELENNDEKEEQ